MCVSVQSLIQLQSKKKRLWNNAINTFSVFYSLTPSWLLCRVEHTHSTSPSLLYIFYSNKIQTQRHFSLCLPLFVVSVHTFHSHFICNLMMYYSFIDCTLCMPILFFLRLWISNKFWLSNAFTVLYTSTQTYETVDVISSVHNYDIFEETRWDVFFFANYCSETAATKFLYFSICIHTTALSSAESESRD